MTYDLTTTNQNAKLALVKSKNLLNITNIILAKKEDQWVNKLFQWADENCIPNYEWVEDKDFDEGGYYNGIPRDENTLLSLKILRLNDLHIEQLPIEFFNLIQLEELKINNSNLRILSNEIKKLNNLTDLYLANNNLNNLPDDLKYLQKLKEIHLHSNNFSVFPEVIYLLFSLEHICIDVNQPCSMSSKIEDLKNLTDIQITNLIEIPIEIQSLPKLTKIKLYENDLGNFPRGIDNLINQEQLFLYGKKLIELPDEIFSLQNLKTLFIVDFKKIQITKEITFFEHIYFLNCDEIIFDLENDYYQDVNLIGFAIINSDIEQLPSSITKIKQIQQLFLTNVKNLLLTSEQKIWIKSLQNQGLNIVYDEGLLDRNINNKITF